MALIMALRGSVKAKVVDQYLSVVSTMHVLILGYPRPRDPLDLTHYMVKSLDRVLVDPTDPESV